jgi:hypothetical protein
MGGKLLAVKGEAFPGNAVKYELPPFFRSPCQLAVNLDVEPVTVETLAGAVGGDMSDTQGYSAHSVEV